MEGFREYGLDFGRQDEPEERLNLWLGALRDSVAIRRSAAIAQSVERALEELPAKFASEDAESAAHVAELLVMSDDFGEVLLGVELARQATRQGVEAAERSIQIAHERGVPR